MRTDIMSLSVNTVKINALMSHINNLQIKLSQMISELPAMSTDKCSTPFYSQSKFLYFTEGLYETQSVFQDVVDGSYSASIADNNAIDCVADVRYIICMVCNEYYSPEELILI